MFNWTVVDYANFTAYEFTIYGLRTFITTPLLCYFLGIHDCMLAITGGMATIAGGVTTGLATEGWMMYYANALTIVGGIESTPLRLGFYFNPISNLNIFSMLKDFYFPLSFNFFKF